MKALMYDSYYNYINKRYGQKARLLSTDIESVVYVINTNDVYEDFNIN